MCSMVSDDEGVHVLFCPPEDSYHQRVGIDSLVEITWIASTEAKQLLTLYPVLSVHL